MVREEGTHEELIKLEGLYHSLVMRLVKGRGRGNIRDLMKLEGLYHSLAMK